MRFEWDEQKRRINLKKHGIDFLRAQRLFDGRLVVTQLSPAAGEDRWKTTGMLEDRFITVYRTRFFGHKTTLCGLLHGHG